MGDAGLYRQTSDNQSLRRHPFRTNQVQIMDIFDRQLVQFPKPVNKPGSPLRSSFALAPMVELAGLAEGFGCIDFRAEFDPRLKNSAAVSA